MAIEPDVLHGIMMSTWSLKEAAYYVHNLAPTFSDVAISPKSISRSSKTYFWLTKELDNGHIKPVVFDEDGVPRFSPGTIMRRLENKGEYFHKPILIAYKKHGVMTGPSKANRDAKFMYLKAANLVRIQHPKIRKAQVAELLTQLPERLRDKSLPGFATTTIRKILNTSQWPGKPGRPPKGEEIVPDVDWAAVIKELI